MAPPKPVGIYFRDQGVDRLVWRLDSLSLARPLFGINPKSNKGFDDLRNGRYYGKAITAEEKEALKLDDRMLDNAIQLIKTNGDWNIPQATVDIVKCEGPCEKFKEKTSEYFPIENGRLRGTCRECRKKSNNDYRSKLEIRKQEYIDKGLTTFPCRGNDHGQDAHEAILDHMRAETVHQCTECYNHQRRIEDHQKKLKNPSVAELRERLKDQIGTCSECKEEKSVGTHFIIKSGRLNASSICKECTNKRGYWISSRKRRRELDEYEYLKRNAEIMREWRERNAEHFKMYMRKYHYGVEGKWVWYKRRATENQLPIDDEHHEQEIKDLFLSLCTYCAREPDIYDVNGLDRIDNTKGYTIDNIVSCCKSCNMMKGKISVTDFIGVACRISEFHTNPDMDLPYPNSNMSNGGIVPTKYKTLEVSNVYEVMYNEAETLCYLCNTPRSETPDKRMTVDRVDSDLDYTAVDNLQPCCSSCNMTKLDYDVNEFITHCHRIAKRVNEIMEEIEVVTSKVSTGPSVIQERPVKRKNNQYIPHNRAKPVLIRDPSKDNKIVAAYPSRASAQCDLKHMSFRNNISKSQKFQHKFIVEECTRDVYESTFIPDDVYQEFKSELVFKQAI